MCASISITFPPIVSVSRNDTLEINGIAHQAADPYSGTLNLGEGATLDMEQRVADGYRRSSM